MTDDKTDVPQTVIDELYSELDDVVEDALDEGMNPLEASQLVHDYAEQLKIEILAEQRKTNHEP